MFVGAPEALAQTSPQAERWGPRIVYEPADNVEVISDLVYAQHEQGRTLKFDLYLPRDRSTTTIPGIIAIRGGGWHQGDKEGFAPIASRLAEDGFAVASIEYRTSQEAPFPAAVHDVKAAARWMRANAKQYGIDDTALGAIGGSAGAHLAILLATSSGIPELEGADPNLETSSQIQAAVGMATPSALTDFTERPVVQKFLAVSSAQHPESWVLASPISHVDQTDPPLLLLHSDSDDIVPYQQSVKLAQRYAGAGITSEVVKFPRAPHAFWHFPAWFDEAMEQAITFFNAELRSPRRPAIRSEKQYPAELGQPFFSPD
ncbi:MAG: alpha/beta hydrolase [Cyanobacteria bacterium P01_A01_bin.17]